MIVIEDLWGVSPLGLVFRLVVSKYAFPPADYSFFLLWCESAVSYLVCCEVEFCDDVARLESFFEVVRDGVCDSHFVEREVFDVHYGCLHSASLQAGCAPAL